MNASTLFVWRVRLWLLALAVGLVALTPAGNKLQQQTVAGVEKVACSAPAPAAGSAKKGAPGAKTPQVLQGAECRPAGGRSQVTAAAAL